MNRRLVTILLVLVLLFTSACSIAQTLSNIWTSVGGGTTGVSAQEEPKEPSSDGGIFLERPVTIIEPDVSGEIDWNEQLPIDTWEKLPGLAPGVFGFYNQSAVGKTLVMKNFEVKTGANLVFGGVSMDIRSKNLKTGEVQTLSRTGGVYGVVKSEILIEEMTIFDGFAIMVSAKDSRNEFCARLQQNHVQGWALSTTLTLKEWDEPICDVKFSVPVDSDRIGGGSLPIIAIPTPAP